MNCVKNSIGWADFTWNPITGCKRGCKWCYARRINDRFNDRQFTTIVFHHDRICEPFKRKKAAKIFVGSMSDIEYWPLDKTNKILDICDACPQHTFMFLTKNPMAYDKIRGWPKNCMQGLTVTLEKETIFFDEERMRTMQLFPRAFLSIEPLLGKMREPPRVVFEKAIVGAMTGPGATKPRAEWIESIRKNVLPEKDIYWKKNIQKYL